MHDEINERLSLSAIKVYLQGFGYKASVDYLQQVVHVQDPKVNSFVIVSISNWEKARLFIDMRSKLDV
jgi:hypothetical protein